MSKKILVAFDGSEPSSRAFHVALEMAEKFQWGLLVVAVISLPESKSTPRMEAFLEESHAQFDAVFTDLREIAQKKGVTLETAIEAGHPAEHIISRAEKEGCEHIVLGRRGMSRIERWVIGSVSERVLRYAHCPVTVVK